MDTRSELVEIYLSSNKDRDILVVNSIPDNVTDETLENFLEVVCKTEIDHLYFHKSTNGKQVRDVTMVILQEKIADFSKVKEKAREKKIGGRLVDVSLLGQPTGIVAYSLPRETTEDEITLYFERKSVAGSNADVVQCRLDNEINIAVLLYGDPDKALQNVLKMRHKMRGQDIEVEPYYNSFHYEVIQCLRLDNPYLEACFVQTTKPSSEKPNPLGETTKPLTENTKLLTDIKTKQDVRKGEQLCRPSAGITRLRMFSEDMDEFPTDITDEDGYMVPVSDKGGNKKQDNFNQVPVFAIENNKQVNQVKTDKFSDTTRSEHIYAEIDDDALEKTIKPPIPLSPRPTEKRQHINANIQDRTQETVKLKKGQALLLLIKGFDKECQVCDVKLNVANESVSFDGSKDFVMATKLQMYEYLGDIVEVTQAIMKCQLTVLQSNPNWVTSILKKGRIPAICSTQDSDVICCQAFSRPVAEKGLKTVLSNLETIEIPYTESNFKFLSSDDWKTLMTKIHKDLVSVEVIRAKKVIVISGRKGDCQSARDNIKKELGKHTEAQSQKIEIKGGKAVCIHHGHQQEIDRLQREIRKKNGNLIHKYDRRVMTIELKGDSGTVEDTKTEIQLLISSVWQGPVDLQKISNKDKDVAIVSKALDCSRGRDFLSTFEHKHKCGVNIEKTKETHELHHVHTVPTINEDQRGELPRRHTVSDFEGGARPKERRPQRGPGNSWICSTMMRSTEVILKQGNIASERADVLVNVVAEGCKFSTSRIALTFMKNGGQLVEQNYMVAREDDEDNCVIMTDNSGIQQCKAICHIVLPKYTGNKLVLQKAINRCMRQCDRGKFTCVAFPCVGTGQLLKYPLDEVVDCLISESKQTSQKSNCIKKIKFIIYDDSHIEKFKEKLQGPSASGSGNQQNRRSKSYDKDDQGPKVKEADKHKETIPVVALELCSVSKMEGEKLRTQLCKDIKDTYLFEEKYKNQQLKSISNDCSNKMFKAARQHHVWMKHDDDCLTLRGEKEAVLKTKNDVLVLLLQNNSGDHHGNHGNRGKSRDAASHHYKKYSQEWWFHESHKETSIPRYWKLYKDDGLLNAAKNDLKDIVGIKGNLEDVDDQTKRLIISLVHKTWDTTLVGQGKDARGLRHSNIKITRVQRIENQTVYNKYFVKKKELCLKLSAGKKFPALENVANSSGQKLSKGPVRTTQNIDKFLMSDLDLAYHANEHYLFHGTQEQYVKNIKNKGIDEKLGGERAMFGAGIYAAESPTKADQYADDEGNRKTKDRKMLLIRLLLGNMFVTNKPDSKLRIPPCSKCLSSECRKDTHEPFDSVVADGPWLFREFIVYRNEQCYPEYLITYDRV